MSVSVRLSVRAAHWFAEVRDAVSPVHGPSLGPAAALRLPHPAAVRLQGDQHPEVHQVRRSLSLLHGERC